MKIIFLDIILKNYLAQVLGMTLPEISNEIPWVTSMSLSAFPPLLAEINFPSSISCSNRHFQAVLCPGSLTECTRYGLVTSAWPAMGWSTSYVWSHVEAMRDSSTYQRPILIMQIGIMERFSTGGRSECSQPSMIWDLFGVNFHWLPLRNITFEFYFLTQIKLFLFPYLLIALLNLFKAFSQCILACPGYFVG